MTKNVFNSRRRYALPLVAFMAIFSAFQILPQRLADIVLPGGQLTIVPGNFYIAGVINELKSNEPVAILVSGARGVQPQTYTADIKGGAVPAVRQFIVNNLPRDTGLSPIIIGLKKIGIAETAQAGNRVEGHAEIVFSFYSGNNDDDKIYLADYTGSIDYNRDIAQTQYIGPALRKVLVNGLAYVNKWMQRQAATDVRLAKKVEISFSNYADKVEDDTIYYAVKRPLTWADFRGRVPLSKYSAEVFPSMGYDQKAEVADGIIKVRIALKAYLPKSAAWVKSENRSDYTLNHEQRHFDIAKIGAERFKQKLTTANLLPGNYEGIVNMDYLDAYREMTNLQKQYDSETRHGMDIAVQERWNAKIDNKLKELGVK